MITSQVFWAKTFLNLTHSCLSSATLWKMLCPRTFSVLSDHLLFYLSQDFPSNGALFILLSNYMARPFPFKFPNCVDEITVMLYFLLILSFKFLLCKFWINLSIKFCSFWILLTSLLVVAQVCAPYNKSDKTQVFRI